MKLENARIIFKTIPLAKGVRSSRGWGFLGPEPVGLGTGKNRQVFLMTPGRVIGLPPADKGPLAPWAGDLPWAAGLADAKGSTHAALWLIGAAKESGTRLPEAVFRETFVNGQNGWTVIGTGRGKGDEPDRALLWEGNTGPMELASANPAESTYGNGGHDGVQVGSTGGVRVHEHACMWRRSSESYVDLNPAGHEISTALDAADGEQVGWVAKEALYGRARRAALWRGSADSFVDLTPEACLRAEARACAGGYQAGHVLPGQGVPGHGEHAWLWHGSADAFIDLHPVEGHWTDSMAHRMRAGSGKLLLVGTVERKQRSGQTGCPVLEQEQAAMWEVVLPSP